MYESGEQDRREVNKRHRGEHRRIVSQWSQGVVRRCCAPQATEKFEGSKVVTYSTHWPHIPDITHILRYIQRINTTVFVIVILSTKRRSKRSQKFKCYCVTLYRSIVINRDASIMQILLRLKVIMQRETYPSNLLRIITCTQFYLSV